MDESRKDHNISSIKEILSDLFRVGEIAHIYKNRDIYYIWSQVCPEKYLDVTRMKGFYRNTLTIEVSSSAVLQEISTFYKTEILEKLQQIKGNKIQKLVFKMGSFESDPHPPEKQNFV